MLLVLASNLTAKSLQQVDRHLAAKAVLLPAADNAEALDIARRLPVSLVLANMTPLTADRITTYTQIVSTVTDAVFCCLASETVREQIKTERLFEPDFWLDPEAPTAEMNDTLTAAVDKARMRSDADSLPHQPDPLQQAGLSAPYHTEQDAFRRLLPALATESEPDRLLGAYADAAAELVRCTSHCLLARDRKEGHFSVRAAHGLHPQIATHGRLLRDGPLLAWYDRNNRILTAEELDRWADARMATGIRREMSVFHGQVIVPLVVAGEFAALLMLGQKVLGDDYTTRELETLFTLSRHVGLQVERLQRQQHHHHLSAHMQGSITAIDSGLISLGSDQRIVVCNPAAARILRLRREDVEGADLRCLPSPLGDLLYAAFSTPGAEVADEKLQLHSLGIWVNLSVSRMQDDQGQAFGSVMLIQNVTEHLAEQARNAEQTSFDLISHLVGHITHSVRTPMTSIRTYGELMDEAHQPTELADFWHRTVTPELQRLDHLLDQLVQLTQEAEPDLQLVDLESLLVETIRKVSGSDSGLRAAPVLRIDSPVSRIVVDPVRTRDALSYLLRYLESAEGSPVTVSVDQQHDENGSNARIRMYKTVESPDLTADQLFDPLLALRQPLADLGPLISRQIVDRLGGTINARDEDGGIEVTIAFPVTATEVVHRPEEIANG
jgi:signal transduction histidine kinase